MELIGIGFWPRECDNESPFYLLNEQKDYNQFQLASYLQSGFKLRGWLGHSFCRFSCGIPRSQMGSSDVTDGVWVWPEGFLHYVEFHNIDLPQEFVFHVQENNYQVNIPPDLKEILKYDRDHFFDNPSNSIGYDNSSWYNWLEQRKAANPNRNSENVVIPKYPEEKIKPISFDIIPEDDSFLYVDDDD